MKTLFSLYVFCLTGLVGLAQSQLDFRNDSNSLVYTNALAVGGTRGLMPPPPPRYYFGLFIAPDGVSDSSLFTFTGLYATNTAVAGQYSGGTDVQVAGWPAGSSVMLQVRGWSESLGHDWTSILGQEATGQWQTSGFYGESALILVTSSGLNPSPLRPVFGSFDLMAVPEPSGAALAGAMLLLGFVWRRQGRSSARS